MTLSIVEPAVGSARQRRLPQDVASGGAGA
jgi:hypothetical protein